MNCRDWSVRGGLYYGYVFRGQADYLMHGGVISWACTYCPGRRADLGMNGYSVGRGIIFPAVFMYNVCMIHLST